MKYLLWAIGIAFVILGFNSAITWAYQEGYKKGQDDKQITAAEAYQYWFGGNTKNHVYHLKQFCKKNER